MENDMDRLIAERIKQLRTGRGWSLDALAKRSGVSRATLSRLENEEVSPTANVLGKLCAAFELTLSRLMHLAEGDFAALVRRANQPTWNDAAAGFRRRSVSSPAQSLAGEVIECELEPGAHISYDRPPRPGLEHHLLMLEGQLDITIGPQAYKLLPGDCLRYQLFGPSSFATPAKSGAKYIVFMV
jgi:transcriptional regulator with XRE-family HTH domain